MVVLECLLENDGVATQDELIDALWGDDPDGGPLCVEEIVRQYIHCLRKHLKPGYDIHNVFNHSYRLVSSDFTDDVIDWKAHVDHSNDLCVDGKKYHLTPTQAVIMRLLLEGRPVSVSEIENQLWPNDAEYEAHTAPQKTVHVHIHQMRRAQPLHIRNIPCVGYILETEMTDKPRPPEVDQALGRIKSDFEEGHLRDLDIKPGPREFSGHTGTIKGENEKIEVEIIVRPREEKNG